MRAPGRPPGRITPTEKRTRARSHSNREWLTAATSALDIVHRPVCALSAGGAMCFRAALSTVSPVLAQQRVSHPTSFYGFSQEATMSFSIFDRGEGRFDLMRGDTEIGWIA